MSLSPEKIRMFRMLSREHLRKWWMKGLRHRTLFTALTEEDRGFLYLTMKVVDKVRSISLGRILVGILKKLRDATRSEFVRRMEEFGLRRAREVAGQALEWGYGAAQGWAANLGFIKYLTSMDMNKPTGFGI